MDDVRLDYGDMEFLRTLPRLITRHTRAAVFPSQRHEDARVKRLQSQSLIRCVIDGEHTSADFVMAELVLTDAGRALLGRDV